MGSTDRILEAFMERMEETTTAVPETARARPPDRGFEAFFEVEHERLADGWKVWGSY